MNNTKIIFVLIFLSNFSSCDKYDLVRTNSLDPKSINYNPPLPELTTTAATAISSNSATLGGNVTSDAGYSIVARGVCCSININPTITLGTKTSDGTGTGIFTSSVTGLAANTTYYVRAYATNSTGTAYGNELTFTTPETVTDLDGNVYNSVIIGTQVWMTENLKVTKYNDNGMIKNVSDIVQWSNLTSDAYCWYADDASTYKATYGGLYNWYAVNSGKLCPTNWHVPTDSEWHQLVLFLDPDATNNYNESNTVGGKLKEANANHWITPNTGSTNESGFTGLPGGYREYTGYWASINYNGLWWSSTELNTTNSWYRQLNYDNNIIIRDTFRSKKSGFSIRCLKN